MKWADEFRGKFGVRANADIPRDAKAARLFGAEGIGLCRTEHMFFAEDRIPHMQAMILARDEKIPHEGAAQTAAHAAQGFRGPVHGHGRIPGGDPHARSSAARIPAQARRPDGGSRPSSLTPTSKARRKCRRKYSIPVGELKKALPELLHRVEELHEFNPMLGHRGCRLGITYPEITEMQARAIFEAAVLVAKKGIKVIPEVMIPLVGNAKELENQKAIVERVAKEVLTKAGMQEAALPGRHHDRNPARGDHRRKVAEFAEFFSFGTNDLTQTTMGLSRDDYTKFSKEYENLKIFKADPFAVIDQEGVGRMMRRAF